MVQRQWLSNQETKICLSNKRKTQKMMWLIIFMLVVAYIIADRKGIMKEIKMLWEKIKERYEI